MRKNGLIFLILLAIGCNPIAKIIVGQKTPKIISVKDLNKWAVGSKLNDVALFTLDTNFANLIDSLSIDPKFRKAFKQPILVLGFINRKLITLNNNCNFPGLPTIKWNEFGNFNTFLPNSSYSDSLLWLFSYKYLAQSIKPCNIESATFNKTKQDTILAVIVNKTFNRQSKALIETIQKNYASKSRSIIYINNDTYIYYKLNVPFD